MTSPTSLDVREVIFINERCRLDYAELLEDVRESADQAIDAVQNGRNLPPKMFKPLKGKLAGVSEIRLPYDNDTFRIYLTLECRWVVMVLDAGIKKSTDGSNVPKWQQERLEHRFKTAKKYFTNYDRELREGFDDRQARQKPQKDQSRGRKS